MAKLRGHRNPKIKGVKFFYAQAVDWRFDTIRKRKRLSKKARKELYAECRSFYKDVYNLARELVPVLHRAEKRRGVRHCVLGTQTRVARSAWQLAMHHLHMYR